MGGGASGASAVVVRSVSGVAAVVGRWWVGGGSVRRCIFLLHSWAVRWIEDCAVGLFAICAARRREGGRSVRFSSRLLAWRRHRVRGRFAGLRIAPLGYSPFAQLGGEGVGAACGSRLGCWGGGGIGGGWRADMISLGGWAVGSVRRRLEGWVGSAAAASAAAGGLI